MGSPGDRKVDMSSSESRGSPVDVPSDKPLIYRTSGVLLNYANNFTRGGNLAPASSPLAIQYD